MTPKKTMANSEFVPFSLLMQGGKDEPQTIDPYQQGRREAARLIREAEQTLSEARQQAADIEKQAYDKGFAEGRTKGEADGRQKYDEAAAQLAQLMVSLQSQRTEIQGQYEKDLLPVVIAMVDKLVQHEISVNSRVIASCLRNSLQYVADSATVRVHLHPDDFSRVKEAALSNPDILDSRKQLDLIEDDTVSVGGCLLTSDFGEVDASLDRFKSRLYQAVESAFLAALAEAEETSTE